MGKKWMVGLLAGLFVGAVGSPDAVDAKKRTPRSLGESAEQIGVVTAVDTDGFVMKNSPVDVNDLQKLLEAKDLYVYKYDLSTLRDTTLEVVLRIDEHFGRDSMRTIRWANLGAVYSRWDSTYLTDLRLMFVPKTDSTISCSFELENRMLGLLPLVLRKAEPDFKAYGIYYPKAFRAEALKVGRMTPIVLLGAVWYDARLAKRYGYPAYRFCMEKELDTDMHNEAFDRMPHYWVIRVGLAKRK